MLDTKRRPPFRSMREQTLERRYKFFRANIGYIVGRSASIAMRLARAEERAENLGLTVEYADEIHDWDGDGPCPPIHVWACVRHEGEIIASLGSIGLVSWRDPYVRVVEAELLSEALDWIYNRQEAQAKDLARGARVIR